MILIVNYGMGNLRSVSNALRRLGYDHRVSGDPADIAKADAVVVPGVGAFGEAMQNLRRANLVEALGEHVRARRKPYLGICLGMQLLAEDSEEAGLHAGLGWVPGHVRRLANRPDLRVPQVGWNTLKVRPDSPLFSRTPGEPSVYFDHSYHFVCDPRHVAATCDYGGEVVAAIQADHVFGVQFHPEKSQTVGLKLFRGFFHHLGLRA